MTRNRNAVGDMACVAMAALMIASVGCSKKDSSGGGGGSGIDLVSVTGSLVSPMGPATVFADNVLVLLDKASGVARTAAVDASGNFTMEHIDPTAKWTMTLLSADYRVVSTFAMKPEKDTKLRSYFTITGDRFPMIAAQGPALRFEDLTDVTIDTSFAADDADTNEVPDGMDAMWGLSLVGLGSSVDTRGEGGEAGLSLAASAVTTDTDKDGLMNVLDPDDDTGIDSDETTPIIDAFDADSNGDGTADSAQSKHDQYYGGSFKSITATIDQGYEGGSAERVEMLLTATLGADALYDTIAVTGADFLEGAELVTVAADGTESAAAWNAKLYNDGHHEDAASRDRVFAARVRLATGKAPSAYHVLVYKATVAAKASVASEEQVYTLPNYTTDDITVTAAGSGDNAIGFEAATEDTPFGSHTEFTWSVEIRRDGALVYASPALASTETSHDVPAQLLTSGIEYSATVIASTPSRIAGRPAVIVRSAAQSFTY